MKDLKQLFGSVKKDVRSLQQASPDGLTLPLLLSRYETDSEVMYAVGTNLLNNQEVKVEIVKTEGQGKRGMAEIKRAASAGDTIIFENTFPIKGEENKFKSYYAQTPDNISEKKDQKKVTQTLIGYGFAAKSTTNLDQTRIFEQRKISEGQIVDATFPPASQVMNNGDHFGGAYAVSAEEIKNYVQNQWESGKDVYIRVMLKNEGQVEKINFTAGRTYRQVQENEPYNRASSNAQLDEFLNKMTPMFENDDFLAGLNSNDCVIELLNMQRWTAGSDSKLDSNVKAKQLGLGAKDGFFTNEKNPNDPNDRYGINVVTPMIVPGQFITMDGAENPLRYMHDGWNPVKKVGAKFLQIDDVPSPWYRPSNDNVLVRTINADGTVSRGVPEQSTASQQTQNTSAQQTQNTSAQQTQKTASQQTQNTSAYSELTRIAPAQEMQNQTIQQTQSASVQQDQTVSAQQGPLPQSDANPAPASGDGDWEDINMDDIDLDDLIGEASTNLSAKPTP